MPTYETLGKYIVDVRPALKQVDIYAAQPAFTNPFAEPVKYRKGGLVQSLKKYLKVWVGDNLSPPLKQPERMPIGAHYQPKGKFRGNTLLVQLSKQEYVFIGQRIQKFKLPADESVVKYVSPVSESESSMPYIIGKHNVYFLESASLPFLPKVLLDLKWDAYTQRWEHSDTVKHLLAVKRKKMRSRSRRR